MSQQELVKKVVHALDNARIEYMMTGSVVSSLQGEPRSTHDIDIVVIMHPSSIKKLIHYFPSPDYYLDEKSIVDAIQTKNTFNLLDMQEGIKVDFWMLTDDPFDQSRFSRKYTEDYQGLKIQVSRPEDTIIIKLKWAKLSGGSEKQFIDALRVYEIQRDNLDMDYLKRWVQMVGLESLWNRLEDEAEKN